MKRFPKATLATCMGLILLSPSSGLSATVTWDGGAGDGSWHSAANWSGDVSPDAADDVVVPVGVTVAVVESVTVKSLTLRPRSGLNASGNGVVFEAATALVDGANLSARQGASIFLPGLLAYQNTDSNGGSAVFSAVGIGSVLNLPNLSKLASNFGSISVGASDGAEVRMPALPQVIQGSVTFAAHGEGSRIDLSALVRFTGGTLSVGENGEISADALERLNSSYLKITGPGSISLPALTDLDLSSISIGGGAQWSPPARVTSYQMGGNGLLADGPGSVLDLSGIATLAAAEVYARAGAEIRLSGVSQLEGGRFSATGDGSRIDFSNLNRITGGSLEVADGGSIEANALQRFNRASLNISGPSSLPLPALQDFNSSSISLSSGATWSPPDSIVSYQSDRGSSFYVGGIGTVLDLSNLRQMSVTPDSGGSISISAEGGAEILLPSLPQVIQGNIYFAADGEGSRVDLSSLVRLTGGSLSVHNRGVIAAAALQRLDFSTLTIGFRSALTLPALETFDHCSVALTQGATWNPPSRITKLLVGQSQFSASGVGTLLDFSGITEMSSDGFGVQVYASEGAEVRLPALSRIFSGPGRFVASGEGSLIDLSSLERLTGGQIIAQSQGTIAAGVGAPQLLLEGVGLEAAKGGRIRSRNIVSAGSGQLSGDGRIAANLDFAGTFTSAGVFNPLTIEGDLVLRGDSRLDFIVTGTETPADHVQLVVTGRATLTGRLGITPQNPALFEINDGFRLMSWAGHAGEFSAFTDLSAGAQQEFIPVYSADHLSLKVTPSVAPTVVEIQPATAVSGSLSQVTVLFSEPIEPTTFTAEDLTISGPDGTAIAADAVIPLNARTFRVTFGAQTAVGSYEVTVGPDIADFAQIPMPAAQAYIVRLQALQGEPTITAPPISRVVGPGTAVELSVSATSESGLSYQWRFNGQPIAGATGAAYTIPAADAASAGRYTVVVTNEAGSVESAPANVSLFDVATFVGTIITGPVGATYRIEYRDELAPEDAWQPATTLTLAASPTVWIDENSRAGTRRFFRAILVNP